MTVTPDERIQMLEVALQMLDNLLDHELTDTARKNAQAIIRHILKETPSQ